MDVMVKRAAITYVNAILGKKRGVCQGTKNDPIYRTYLNGRRYEVLPTYVRPRTFVFSYNTDVVGVIVEEELSELLMGSSSVLGWYVDPAFFSSPLPVCARLERFPAASFSPSSSYSPPHSAP